MVITASATTDRLNEVSSPATAVSTIAIASDPTGPDLHGVVEAGSQPVAGASVYLYAAGTTGYASASTPISSPAASTIITTDSAGTFTIPAGYSCPQLTNQVYLVAIGGQAGSNGQNPNLALMTALGSCRNLGSTTFVINEITTAASAAALATFSADNIQTGEMSYLYIGASSANSTVGLANAFASVNNLVDITTGQPKFWTVAGNASVPYVEINTLADALNACAVTSGGSAGDETACGNLFTYTNPLSTQYPAYAPTDTLQAMFDLLKPPSPDITNQLAPKSVFGLAGLSSPYQPILTTSPNEWAISLNYTFGGGVGGAGATGSGSSAFALDSSGNLWIANTNTSSVSEWSNLGAPISPANLSALTGGFTGGGIYSPVAVAVDPSGYVWIVNGNSTLTKLDGTGTEETGSPFAGGGLSAGSGIAIDGSGNVWVTSSGSPGSVAKFNTRGIAQSPSTGFTAGIGDPSVIAIDGADNIWVYNQKSNNSTGVVNYAKLNGANGSLTVGLASPGANPPQFAIDKSGNIWSADGIQVLEIPAGYTNLISSPQPNHYPTDTTSVEIGSAQGMAFDGSNRLWVADAGSSGNNITPNLTLLDTALPSPDVAVHYFDTSFSNGPSAVAVDSAGNVWVLLGNNTVKEYVGLAAPVVTPISLGAENNKLGTKP
jgi:sugar lactone lactonase YvrE